ncbi:hypothetical protein LXL04_026713 [Taraxacum kok-saghyz]
MAGLSKQTRLPALDCFRILHENWDSIKCGKIDYKLSKSFLRIVHVEEFDYNLVAEESELHSIDSNSSKLVSVRHT